MSEYKPDYLIFDSLFFFLYLRNEWLKKICKFVVFKIFKISSVTYEATILG